MLTTPVTSYLVQVKSAQGFLAPLTQCGQHTEVNECFVPMSVFFEEKIGLTAGENLANRITITGVNQSGQGASSPFNNNQVVELIGQTGDLGPLKGLMVTANSVNLIWQRSKNPGEYTVYKRTNKLPSQIIKKLEGNTL